MVNRRQALALAGFQALPSVRAQSVMRASTLFEQDPATIVATRVMTEAYRRVGLTLKVIGMPGERSLVSANEGVTDAELYRRAGIELNYSKLLMVPVPLLTYEVVAFSRSASPPVIKGWESLRPYRLGFIKGVKVIEERTAGMQVDTVTTLQQAMAMLELGRTDLVLGNRLSGLAVLRALGFKGVQVLEPPLATFPVFHYLNRRHASWVEPLTTVLREMERERWIAAVHEEVLGGL